MQTPHNSVQRGQPTLEVWKAPAWIGAAVSPPKYDCVRNVTRNPRRCQMQPRLRGSRIHPCRFSRSVRSRGVRSPPARLGAGAVGVFACPPAGRAPGRRCRRSVGPFLDVGGQSIRVRCWLASAVRFAEWPTAAWGGQRRSPAWPRPTAPSPEAVIPRLHSVPRLLARPGRKPLVR